MISFRALNGYCKDDISLVENYEEAVNSTEKYDCHHRLEIELNLSAKELKERDLYFNRPASELIFLTKSEHLKLHNKEKGNPMYNKQHTLKTKQKMSEQRKGRIPWNKGIPISEEQRKKLSDKAKGRTPWNKGKKGIVCCSNSWLSMSNEAKEERKRKQRESLKKYWEEKRKTKKV